MKGFIQGGQKWETMKFQSDEFKINRIYGGPKFMM